LVLALSLVTLTLQMYKRLITNYCICFENIRFMQAM